jgi:hypothetical protein
LWRAPAAFCSCHAGAACPALPPAHHRCDAGDMDAVSSEFDVGSNAWKWMENIGGSPSTFTMHTVTASLPTEALHAVDMDRDGDVDLAVTLRDSADGKWGWFENNGGGNFTERVVAAGFPYPSAVHCVDFDNDTDLDCVMGSEDGRVRYYEQNGVGSLTWTLARNVTIYYNVPFIDTADVDQDGLRDIVVATGMSNVLVW